MEDLVKILFLDNALLQGTLSAPKEKAATPKITVRKIALKGKEVYQVSYHDKKIIHENLSGQTLAALLLTLLPQYKQAQFSTADEQFHVLQSKKGKVTILRKQVKTLKVTGHNRPKNTLLKEGEPIPFLVDLGVMTKAGKVAEKKWDKFRQINRFLELVSDIIAHFPKEKTLRVVDFGCGKAYLTFALYHYLQSLGYPLEVIGLDLKEDVVAFCQAVADRLQFTHLHFQQGDIQSYSTENPVDLVVCLHACDTATDVALQKAIDWQTKVIMAVPCCQHELFGKVKCEALHPLLKHGVLKERFAALATDAIRANYLEICGYKTQVFEFIDMEHTPKNLMIRAVKQDKKHSQKLIDELKTFKELLNLC